MQSVLSIFQYLLNIFSYNIEAIWQGVNANQLFQSSACYLDLEPETVHNACYMAANGSGEDGNGRNMGAADGSDGGGGTGRRQYHQTTGCYSGQAVSSSLM